MYMYYELIIIIIIDSVQVYILTLASKIISDKGNFHAVPTPQLTYQNKLYYSIIDLMFN